MSINLDPFEAQLGAPSGKTYKAKGSVEWRGFTVEVESEFTDDLAAKIEGGKGHIKELREDDTLKIAKGKVAGAVGVTFKRHGAGKTVVVGSIDKIKLDSAKDRESKEAYPRIRMQISAELNAKSIESQNWLMREMGNTVNVQVEPSQEEINLPLGGDEDSE